MKFPAFADLDQDQRKVYSESPRDGGVLIVGPPGSGKTVLALHRSTRLAKTDKVSLIMFNKTLRQYTSNFEDLPKNVKIYHIHDWVKDWYLYGFGLKYPRIGKSRFDIDWDLISEHLMEASSEQKRRLHWGHLVIDEGQDCPKKMYSTLMKYLRKQNDETLTVSVFADENQTIHNVNSSISEIREELNASPENNRYWRVDKNYRNTKQIAQFSRHFQVLGLGSTSLPDREGIKPTIFVNKDYKDQKKHLVNYCKNQPNMEIGVIVFGRNYHVNKIYNDIQSTFKDNQSSYTVQTYIGANKYQLNDWKSLTFDKPPSITILHPSNSKGLEFDVVFVLNCSGLYLAPGEEISSFKQLYVISSRPRQNLYYMVEASPAKGGFKNFIRMFPKHDGENQLCTYKTTDDELNLVLSDMLSKVEWLPSAALVKREKHGDLARIISELDFEKIIEIISDAVADQFTSDHIPQLIEERLLEYSDIEEAVLDTLVELNNSSLKKIKYKIGQ